VGTITPCPPYELNFLCYSARKFFNAITGHRLTIEIDAKPTKAALLNRPNIGTENPKVLRNSQAQKYPSFFFSSIDPA